MSPTFEIYRGLKNVMVEISPDINHEWQDIAFLQCYSTAQNWLLFSLLMVKVQGRTVETNFLQSQVSASTYCMFQLIINIDSIII